MPNKKKDSNTTPITLKTKNLKLFYQKLMYLPFPCVHAHTHAHAHFSNVHKIFSMLRIGIKTDFHPLISHLNSNPFKTKFYIDITCVRELYGIITSILYRNVKHRYKVYVKWVSPTSECP